MATTDIRNACYHGTFKDDEILYFGTGKDVQLSFDGTNFTFDASAGFQYTQSGNGYSFNLISVTSTGANSNTRALRVNATTADSIAHGDLQCVHGYLTLGSSATLANNAAVYPLSAWIDVPDSTTTGTGNVIAGVRAIFDPNNNDLSALGGGGESAIFYGQVWASTGSLEHGLRLAAGAGTTVKNALSVGGVGTYNTILDLTDWDSDTTCVLVQGGPKDATELAQMTIAMGDATDAAGIVAALGGTSYGSLYLSTAGSVWYNKAGTWTQVGDA